MKRFLDWWRQAKRDWHEIVATGALTTDMPTRGTKDAQRTKT
ncbi:hypothetical protein [Lacticaseibacillus brantae]|nr:hypothetical protein [Lacticaseibacillus brantae]